MKANFDLIPFATDAAPAIEITGGIERQDNQLTIEYKLASKLKKRSPRNRDSPLPMISPPLVQNPSRQRDLWEHTCCEFFLGFPDSTQYWEFNLSPSGHWNVYHLLDYRQNLTEEPAFDALPFQVSQREDYCQLQLKIDLSKIISPEQNLAVGVTAVIEDRTNQLSYWALSHPGKEPDFHHRDAFILEL
ncbi:MAG: DOMON-like domain-containing protein [Waterburya sp.]